MKIKTASSTTHSNNTFSRASKVTWKSEQVREPIRKKLIRQFRREPIEREIRGQLIHNTITQPKNRTREDRYREDE